MQPNNGGTTTLRRIYEASRDRALRFPPPTTSSSSSIRSGRRLADARKRVGQHDVVSRRCVPLYGGVTCSPPSATMARSFVESDDYCYYRRY
ncbi:hypothetical protein Trydic_g91 [Trypoxylus dichotomus]